MDIFQKGRWGLGSHYEQSLHLLFINFSLYKVGDDLVSFSLFWSSNYNFTVLAPSYHTYQQHLHAIIFGREKCQPDIDKYYLKKVKRPKLFHLCKTLIHHYKHNQ